MPLRLYAIGSGNGDFYVVSGSCEIWENSVIINYAISGLTQIRKVALTDGGVHLHLHESDLGSRRTNCDKHSRVFSHARGTSREAVN